MSANKTRTKCPFRMGSESNISASGNSYPQLRWVGGGHKTNIFVTCHRTKVSLDYQKGKGGPHQQQCNSNPRVNARLLACL